MRTIAVANQKGGCGKTTTAINLASQLSLRGQAVLLVDCDPQAHATSGLKFENDMEKSLYRVLTPREAARLSIENTIVPVREGFDLAPSSVMMSCLEQELAEIQGREHRLMRALRPVTGYYDFIILDCPPSIGHLCFNALRACSELIIPIDMSLFSLRGVVKLMDIVLFLKNRLDHDILVRALVTMFDFRTRYSKRVLSKVKEEFGDNVFESVIRYTIRLRESVDCGEPVDTYDRRSIGNMDYGRLSEELMRSRPPNVHRAANSGLADARLIVEKAQSCIFPSSDVLPAPEGPFDFEEIASNDSISSYTQMIDALSRQNGPFDDEDL